MAAEARGQTRDHLEPKTFAETLARSVFENAWGESPDGWRERRNRDGRDPYTFCREYHNTTFGVSRNRLTPREPWALWCQDTDGALTTEWVFHVLGSQEPGEATLQQSRWMLKGDPMWLASVYRELRSMLSEKLGDQTRLVPDGIAVSSPPDENSESWRDARQWRTPEVEILVYRYVDTFNNTPEELGILARSSSLLDEFGREREYATAEVLSNPLESRFISSATALFPEVRHLLTGPDRTQRQMEIRIALQRLLSAVPEARTDRWALTLLVADRLATSLDHFKETPPEKEPTIGPLLHKYLQFEFVHPDHGWYYPRGLARMVLRDFPSSEWAEFAFIELLLTGFGANSIADPAHPEKVVKEATAYLDTRPGSPARAVVTMAIAQASESLWSMSRATFDECAVGGGDGASARRQAIEAYREVARLSGAADPRRRLAQRQILRLQAGYDTGSRAFLDCYP